MPAPQDLVDFHYPKHQVFQNGEWQWVVTPYEGRLDPPPWLSILGIKNIAYFKIPYQSAARPLLVRGAYDPLAGDWEIKFRCLSGESDGTLFHPAFANGYFEQEVDEMYLVITQTTWVYLGGCTHTPPTGGKPVYQGNAIKIDII